jgi:hypothetical protein
MSVSGTPSPATAAQIRAIAGDLDDDIVGEIIRLGATEAEVLEAFTRLGADDAVSDETERTARGNVAAICEILDRAAEEPEPQ